MHEIMRSDPLRRFAHGITIEDTTLRFWISHRAYLVASTPIDINSVRIVLPHPISHFDTLPFQNHGRLVRLFLGIALSTEERLGYDPTMSRVFRGGNDNKKFCYDIEVRDHRGMVMTFRTKDEISTYGADAIRGRGTRVWSAYDVTNDPDGKRLFALKDTWVNADRIQEGDTLRDLRNRLTEKNHVDALKHFLTEVTCGDVHIGNAPDNTGAHIQSGKPFTVESIIESRVASDGTGRVTDITCGRSGSKRPASDGNVELSSAEGTGKILEEHRVHYRIVFEEIGTPVDKLRTFCDIFLAIRDAVVGACFLSHLRQMIIV
jgi:hypothetical protein